MALRGERLVTAAAEILGIDNPADALTRLLERAAGQDPGLTALRAEFWLYAVRNPDAMGALTTQRRQQVDALIGVISAAMERLGTPPGVPAAEVAIVVLARFQGLVRQRRIDPARVSGDLAQGLRWLFAGPEAMGGSAEQGPPGTAPAPER